MKTATHSTIAKNVKIKLKIKHMMKVFCDGCDAELPKKGSRKSIIDLSKTMFTLDGNVKQDKTVFCEDCTEKIEALVKTLKPIKLL